MNPARFAVSPRALLLGLSFLASLAFPAGAMAAPPNDNRASATDLGQLQFDALNNTNVDATKEGASEAMPSCVPSAASFDQTVWYRFQITGPTDVKIEAHSENGANNLNSLDTVAAIYPATGTPTQMADDIACNDDAGGLGSEIVARSLPAGVYHVQVAGFNDGMGTEAGTFNLTADPVPLNDNRAQAKEVLIGDVLETETSRGSLEEADEDLNCNGTAPLGNTVWYAVTVPVRGSLTVITLGDSYEGGILDTVAGVFSPSGAKVACNDEGGSGVGSSRVETGEVPAGRYLIQVGGFGSGDPDRGDFRLSVSFAADVDVDGDGATRPPAGGDCNDNNPGIRPGAVDVPYNGVDEDCSGADNLDADNDGVPRGRDCNDRNASIRPGRKEVKGNFVDENCDRKRPAARLSPTPGILFSRSAFPARRGTVVRALTLSRLRRGYRITVTCKGRGCPKRTQRRTIKKGRKTTFKVYSNRFLRKGAVVTIFVTRPKQNRLGEFFRYKMSATTLLLPTEGCLVPGKLRKRSCRT